VWSGRHGRMALVGAALALGSCQDQAFVRLFPGAEPSTNGGASGLGALGGTGAGLGGTGAPGGAGSAGSGGAGAPSGGSAGTLVAGSAPVGGEAGASGETGAAGEGGDGVVAGEAGAAGAAGSPVDLVHRYDFSGTGTVVRDLVGGADGTFMNGELSGLDYATLDGNDQYIALPSGIISTLRDASFVMWIRWVGRGDWERVFDFGNNTNGPGEIGDGITTFFLTPRNIPRTGSMDEAQIGWQPAPGELYDSELGSVFPSDPDPIQVAVVIDDAQTSLSVYLQGRLLFRAMYPDRRRMVDLSALVDENNWLGRSQWTQDAISNFEGIYDEFRIYATALDDAYIAELYRLGQDTLPE
jgi:hypothetical protein